MYGFGRATESARRHPIAGGWAATSRPQPSVELASKGMAKNTYGTGNFMLMNTGNEPIFSNNGLLTPSHTRLATQHPSTLWKAHSQ